MMQQTNKLDYVNLHRELRTWILQAAYISMCRHMYIWNIVGCDENPQMKPTNVNRADIGGQVNVSPYAKESLTSHIVNVTDKHLRSVKLDRCTV